MSITRYRKKNEYNKSKKLHVSLQKEKNVQNERMHIFENIYSSFSLYLIHVNFTLSLIILMMPSYNTRQNA
jgi:hypothetical protein